MKSATLVIAHGSREEKANRDFFHFLENFRRLYPHRSIHGAFLELAKPSIPQAIEDCISSGARELFIFPLMLFSGRHVKEDIPQAIEEARARHPQVDFHYGRPLSDRPQKLFEMIEEEASSLARMK